jgi:hypothetical protein
MMFIKKKYISSLPPLMNKDLFTLSACYVKTLLVICIKGIVSPDWKGLQMISLDRFEV